MKIYIVMSREAVKKMNGIRGKMLTQAGHAVLNTYRDAMAHFPDDVIAYDLCEVKYKITVQVDTDAELRELEQKYKDVCGVGLVVDHGYTVFYEPTVTCLGIGPIAEENIGEDLRSLKLFK